MHLVCLILEYFPLKPGSLKKHWPGRGGGRGHHDAKLGLLRGRNCKILNTFLSKIVDILRAFTAAVLLVCCSLPLSHSRNDNNNNNNNNKNNNNYYHYNSYKILRRYQLGGEGKSTIQLLFTDDLKLYSGKINVVLIHSFSEAIPIFFNRLKSVFSLSDRYKIFTSNWLWIEICENVVLSKVDITMTTIQKKL